MLQKQEKKYKAHHRLLSCAKDARNHQKPYVQGPGQLLVLPEGLHPPIYFGIPWLAVAPRPKMPPFSTMTWLRRTPHTTPDTPWRSKLSRVVWKPGKLSLTISQQLAVGAEIQGREGRCAGQRSPCLSSRSQVSRATAGFRDTGRIPAERQRPWAFKLFSCCSIKLFKALGLQADPTNMVI